MPKLGHNSSDDRLRLLIERLERLAEERDGLNGDIRDVFGEAKAVGYDPKIMRIILRLRKMQPDARRELKMQPDARRELKALTETYEAALGLE